MGNQGACTAPVRNLQVPHQIPRTDPEWGTNWGIPNRTVGGMNVYRVLEQEWARISATPAALGRLDAWAADETVLAGAQSPAELVSSIIASRRWSSGDPRLVALLRLAADPFAARAVLQAILPGLRTEPLSMARYGFAPAGPDDEYEDVAVDLLAAAWETIRTRAGQTLDHPEKRIVRAATEVLRTRRRLEARRLTRVEVTASPAEGAICSLDDARSAAERVLGALLDAVRQGTVTPRQAELLYTVRVIGTPGYTAGEAHGMSPGQVFYDIHTAERALRRACA